MIDIRERVRFLRDSRNMNNNQLAKAADLNPSVISSLFTRSGEPEISTLRLICDGLGITLSEFFSEGEAYELTKDQEEVLQLYKQIPEDKKELVREVLKAMR